MRLRLAGGGYVNAAPDESYPIEEVAPAPAPTTRRARMALSLSRRSKGGAPAVDPSPTPSAVIRTDEEIARMLRIADLSARQADIHAEGARDFAQWLLGNKDDVSLMVNWVGERGELPK